MDRNRRGNEDEQQREECNERRRRQRVTLRFQYTYRVNNSQSNVDNEEHNSGNMTQTCNYYGALYWPSEVNTARKYTEYCHDGKVSLED